MPSNSIAALLSSFLLLLSPACEAQPARQTADPAQERAEVGQTQGLDPALVERTLQQAEALPRLNSLIIARDGEPLVERSFRGPDLDTPVNIKSASKSVLATLAGIAIVEDVLDRLEQPIAPILTDFLPADPDPRLGRVTVENLLSMQAGLERTSGANYGAWVTSPNWVRNALSRPFVDEPGGRMLYSTGSSHLMSAVLTEASGRSTLELARDWLGEPLGITIPPWPTDPQGIYFGGNDMLLSPRALLQIGELYRNGGVHEGERVLPEGWVEDAWTPRTVSPWSGHGYGLGWFIKDGPYPTYFAWGYGGQMLFVVPDLRMTVVMTSDPNPREERGDHVAMLHALLDGTIIPAAVRGAV